VPELPDVIVIHAALLEALQGQSAREVVIGTEPVPPDKVKDRPLEERV
jgi:hypothetical protein